VRGLSAATLAVAGHCVVTAMVGTLAALLAWVMLEFNRPVVLVATAAGCLLSGIAQLVRAAYGGWSTRRRPTESPASTTASAIYGFVLSPCRPALMLYFATPLVGSRAFALVSVVFGAAAIGSVMFHAALVLGRHQRRYFFQREIACRVIVGIFLCLVSLIVLSRFGCAPIADQRCIRTLPPVVGTSVAWQPSARSWVFAGVFVRLPAFAHFSGAMELEMALDASASRIRYGGILDKLSRWHRTTSLRIGSSRALRNRV
jgi:hypothetical protein